MICAKFDFCLCIAFTQQSLQFQHPLTWDDHLLDCDITQICPQVTKRQSVAICCHSTQAFFASFQQ